MGRDPYELIRDMPMSQARLWMQFYARFPFNPEAMHQVPSASLAALYINAHKRDSEKRVTVSECLPIQYKDPALPEEDEPELTMDDEAHW